MTTITVETQLSYKYLMNKTKDEIVSTFLDFHRYSYTKEELKKLADKAPFAGKDYDVVIKFINMLPNDKNDRRSR